MPAARATPAARARLGTNSATPAHGCRYNYADRAAHDRLRLSRFSNDRMLKSQSSADGGLISTRRIAWADAERFLFAALQLA